MRDRYGKLLYIVAVNKQTINQDLAELKKSGFKVLKRLIGCYKGKLENSYLIEGTEDLNATQAQHSLVADFLALHSQESAVFLDEDRNGYLLYDTGSFSDKLGVWREVTSVVDAPSWSFDTVTGNYYICS